MTIYLYVKQHSVTKLKYFGKTICDVEKYKGSGDYWKRHISKHGREYVTNIQVWEFEDKEEATEFALAFSYAWNIVESKEWANLKPEDSLDGGRPRGEVRGKYSRYHRERISQGRLSGKKPPPKPQELRDKISKLKKGVPRTLEHRISMWKFQCKKRGLNEIQTKKYIKNKKSQFKLGFI